MNQFQIIVLACAGIVTILGSVSMILSALFKKSSAEIKPICNEKFKTLEVGGADRNDRVLILETRFAEIISITTKLELKLDKQSEMTTKIYGRLLKRKTNNT